MKLLLVAAVLLLHSCHADNWRMEVMERLRAVNKHRFTFPPVMPVPSHQMQKTAAACRSTFVAQLRDVLAQLEAKTSDGESVLLELKVLLSGAEQPDPGCRMQTMAPARAPKPMEPYISFIKTLNSTPTAP